MNDVMPHENEKPKHTLERKTLRAGNDRHIPILNAIHLEQSINQSHVDEHHTRESNHNNVNPRHNYFPFLVSTDALTAAACSTVNDTSRATTLVVLQRHDTRCGVTEAPLGVRVTGSAEVRGTQTVATHFSDWRQ
jgi:hypothetical protein